MSGALQDCEVILSTLLLIYLLLLRVIYRFRLFAFEKKKVFASPSYDDDQGLVGQLVDLFVYTCGFFMAQMCLLDDVEIVVTTLVSSHS